MERTVTSQLQAWRKSHRSPLLVRGARQVGKSYVIEKFGREEFRNMITINFDLHPEYKLVFDSPDPGFIITQIELLQKVQITKDTLIFLDEIQECPAAIQSLRYFKELHPDLFIIGAGSLLEFAFAREMKVPVGRIQFLNIWPLTFYEFLMAYGEEKIIKHLQTIGLRNPISEPVHQKLTSLLSIYGILGGMPEVIVTYLTTGSLVQASYVQESLIETYFRDFSKYGRTVELSHLQTAFDAIPRMVSEQIKYVNIDRESRSREIKNALSLLTLARVIHPVFCTDASGLPLGAGKKNRMKYIFLDIGLMQHICGIEAEIVIKKDLMQINRGALAEQYVGQELLSCEDPFLNSPLFFWARDQKGSSSEVDYCITRKGRIYPVEVKSGTTGKLRSLRIFLEEKDPPFGIRFSLGNLGYHDRILSIPLYMTAETDRLIEECHTDLH
ncbi:MAG: ATP-binding protein [Methanospirillaceae archaeon]|nr:ATP-binding protein [Methanospirillaceae archaeon]